MKIYGVILTIFFVLFASLLGGTLRFDISKPSFMTLRLRRREYESKDLRKYMGGSSQATSKKVAKIASSTRSKVTNFHINRALRPTAFLNTLTQNSLILFSQSVIFVKNRLLSPPPTPPPIA